MNAPKQNLFRAHYHAEALRRRDVARIMLEGGFFRSAALYLEEAAFWHRIASSQ